MSRVVRLDPALNYWRLRKAWTSRKAQRAWDRFPSWENEAYRRICEKPEYFTRRISLRLRGDLRHPCTHPRHTRGRTRKDWRLGVFHVIRYPLFWSNHEPTWFLCFWRFDKHWAVDVALKWNIYVFSVTWPRKKRAPLVDAAV